MAQKERTRGRRRKPAQVSRTTIPKTISLTEDILRIGEHKASAEQRSFSNYIAVLIARDANVQHAGV